MRFRNSEDLLSKIEEYFNLKPKQERVQMISMFGMTGI